MKLVADPRNPAQYFGACGLFELAAMRNPLLTAHWGSDGLFIEAWTDDDFNRLVRDFAHATLVPDENWTGEGATRPYTIVNAKLNIRMDWWERRNGNGNSFWKCFGGRQKSTDAAELLAKCKALADQVTADNLLQSSIPLTGRLGFDPRSAWDSLDTGFSPNDLGAALKSVPTYVFAELLSVVALQRWPFQPARDKCRYCPWEPPLPLSLARVHAAVGQDVVYEFSRIKRGQGVSCFTYSRPVRASQENLS